MNIRNCKKCKKLFNYVTGPSICPACKEEMEHKFQEVKKYVQEHGRSGMQEVSEECEVEISQIQQWIREERLIFAADSPMGIDCERCGTIIRGGRFCEKCKMEMANSFNNAMGKQTPPIRTEKKETIDSPKMRFLDK